MPDRSGASDNRGNTEPRGRWGSEYLTAVRRNEHHLLEEHSTAQAARDTGAESEPSPGRAEPD